MSKLFDARAAVLEYEAKQRLIEKEIELEKLKQQRKPLTDEQIIQLAQEWPAETNDWASHLDFARAIEQAHGITGEQK